MSTGFTARRTVGLPAITLKRLEEYIRVVRGLLARETVEWSEEGGPHKIRFLNPELGLINLDDPIPIHLSAFGPQGPRARGKARHRLDVPAAIRAGGGRAEGDAPGLARGRARREGALFHHLRQWLRAAEGEAADSPRARAQAGPSATMIFHDHAEAEELGTLGFRCRRNSGRIFDAYREIYQTYEPADARYLSNHRGHLMFLRPEEQALITPELIRTMTLTGTEAELVEGVRASRRRASASSP